MADKGKRVYLPTETDKTLTEIARTQGLKKSQVVERALRIYCALKATERTTLLESYPTPQKG